MSDIEKLIERLWAINCGSQGCQTTRDEASSALERLTSAPLPAEVDTLIRCLGEGGVGTVRESTKTLAARWQNGLTEALERLEELLATPGRIDLDLRTRYALAFIVEQTLSKEIPILTSVVEKRERALREALTRIANSEGVTWMRDYARAALAVADEGEAKRYRAALATEAKETGDENDRLRAELETAKPLLKAAVRYTNEVTLASRIALAETAQAFAKLDAKKGGA